MSRSQAAAVSGYPWCAALRSFPVALVCLRWPASFRGSVVPCRYDESGATAAGTDIRIAPSGQTRIQEPQSIVDKNEAEAAAVLLNAIDDVTNAAIQIGSLLVVKTLDANNSVAVRIRTLSSNEMIHLEKNQNLLTKPDHVLEELQRISNY